MFTKWLKNFRWMNTRVGKGFFEEKMANLKVFIAKFAKHNSTSFTTALLSRKQLSSGLKYVVK